MLRLPYGISYFVKIATEGYYYVDRTPFLSQLEQLNEPYLFLTVKLKADFITQLNSQTL